MSSTTSVVGTNSEYLATTSTTSTTSTSSSDSIDKDAFMQLLVTQMKYQDPLNPMDNQEMLAQLAQFTALEQMMNVAQASQKQLANGMIGQYVEYLYTDSATGQTSYQIGKVDYVSINGDTPMLGIGDVEVSVEDVYQVIDSSNIQANSSVFDVIGKTVQATTTETTETGEQINVIIEGKVEGIKMVDGVANVIIGTNSSQLIIPYKNVQSTVSSEGVIDKEVTGTYIDSSNTEQTITGTVEYVKITSEGTYLYVNGQFINFNDVETVK